MLPSSHARLRNVELRLGDAETGWFSKGRVALMHPPHHQHLPPSIRSSLPLSLTPLRFHAVFAEDAERPAHMRERPGDVCASLSVSRHHSDAVTNTITIQMNPSKEAAAFH